MERKAVSLKPIKPGVLPGSPAMIANGFVFLSGQIPLDAQGNMPEGISGQTHQVMKNICALLEAAGSSINKVVKTTVYITDFSNFDEMNKAYVSYFDGDLPARSGIGVSSLIKDALVEIEAIALC